MKKVLALALVAIVLVSLYACGASLSGTYAMKGEETITMEFKGGKFYSYSDGELDGEGTYKVDGDTVTITDPDEPNDPLVGTINGDEISFFGGLIVFVKK